jgi:dihydroorotate dehydrogenase
MTPLTSNLLATSYQHLLKPILFKFDAELVHDNFTRLGKMLGASSAAQLLTQAALTYHHPALTKTLDGITFPNPIGLSAGFDYNGELTDILPQVGFGWHTIGTVTYLPYAGNTPPRLGRFPKSQALLVNKGLKSWGAVKVIEQLEGKKLTIPTGISIASTNKQFSSVQEQLSDIARCFDAFEHSSVKHHYYELNISCPNTFGGEPFVEPERLALLLNLTDKLKVSRPMYVKMPIDQSEAATLSMLKVLDQHQVQGLIFGNLTKDHHNPDVHPEDQKSWLTKKGNLSGKPTFNRSNQLLQLTKQYYHSRFTLIGTGGVFSGEDALTKLELGADLVQLITGMVMKGPQLIGQINHFLATSYLIKNRSTTDPSK